MIPDMMNNGIPRRIRTIPNVMFTHLETNVNVKVEKKEFCNTKMITPYTIPSAANLGPTPNLSISLCILHSFINPRNTFCNHHIVNTARIPTSTLIS
jgi:hypothetical protein